MNRVAIHCLFALSLAALLPAATLGDPIDGRTASQWKPQPGWSPGKTAADFSVSAEDGALAFRVTGGVMTWTFEPAPEHLAGGLRYLIFRYRAQGLPPSGDYLLHVQDGSPGWRNYLMQKHLEVDGGERVLAVDLLALLPPAGIEQFALRISTLPGQEGRLDARLSFAAEPPEGARIAGAPAGDRKTARIETESLDWLASPSWVSKNAAETHSVEKSATSVILRASGRGRAMRWRAGAPPQVDVAAMPFLAVRYRARGDFSSGNYVVQTYVVDPKGERKSVHLLFGRDLDADGAWHVFHGRIDARGTTDGLAAGIDCSGTPAELEIDWISFDSQPLLMPVAELIDFQTRDAPWPAREGGFAPLPLPSGKAQRLGPVALARFGIGSWFPSTHVSVAGVPFEVPSSLDLAAASGLVEEDSLAIDLPGTGPAPREILLLLAATFPHREETLRAGSPQPLKILSEPERLVFSLEEASGATGDLLPVHAAKAQYGVGQGLALYAFRPEPGSEPRRLLLHDRMRNAGFAVLGVTLNHGEPRVPEPAGPDHPLPPRRKAPPADAAFHFPAQGGLAWGSITSPMFGTPLDLTGEPVFSLRLAGGREIPSSEWKLRETRTEGDGSFLAQCDWSGDGASLTARFEAKSIDARSVLLSLDLRNAGAAAVTGTLFFPKLSGVRIGSCENTWYLACRTGGIINRIPCAWRDEIGEPHALPLDGFFNPEIGAGLALMPRDLEGVFRWYCVAKDDRGGSYALEYLPQTVRPGEAWTCVPVAVSAVPGDWRDQIALYREWLKTWYRPAAPRKPWFARVFGLPSYCPTQPFDRPLDERVDLLGKARQIEQALGFRDYLHLFGWAITPEHGHWGAYDEFHQVGGLDRFAAEVRKCRDAGTPVGVYLDGYLVSTRAAKPSRERQEEWSVRTAEGGMLYHESYDAHSMCPCAAGWREHLTAAYRRVAAEVRPDGMYLDEFGKCMTSRTCWASGHGHPVPYGMASGEWTLSREIRAAIPPGTALYCEYVPADVACQYLDGAFGHTALEGFRDGYDRFSPSYINLQRFVLPDFKIFELTYYAPLKNGNWFLLKYPFFNGEGYYMTGYYGKGDARSTGFLRNAFRVQHEHADAFTSADVEPLVPTLAPGLYANRFSTPGKTVWTVFNAGYRTLRGPLLSVPHREGSTYVDAWAGDPLSASISGDSATLSFAIGPRQVGCLVQTITKR